MSPQNLLSIWVVSILITLIFVAGVLSLRDSDSFLSNTTDECPAYRDSAKPVVIIGTSLSRDAFSWVAEYDTQRSEFLLWAVPGLKAARAIQLIECAVESGATRFLIEANTFAYEPAPAQATNSGFGAKVEFALQNFTVQVRRLLQGVLDEMCGMLCEEALAKDGVWNGRADPVFFKERGYVAIHHYWIHELRALIQENAIEIMFFEPPRTRVNHEVIYLDLNPEVEVSFLTHSLDSKLIKYWPVWPHHYFKDPNSHLNAEGSKRFREEFMKLWRSSIFAD